MADENVVPLSAQSSSRGKGRERPSDGARRRRRANLLPYSLAIPVLLFEGLFVIDPIVRAVLMSVHTSNFGKTSYVGLSNFDQVLHDPIFWAALKTTFEFVLAMICLWLSFGLGLALVMNWTFRGRGFVRGILSLPWAVPDIPVVMTFLVMLDPNFGVVNRFASWIPGVNHHIQWLTAPNLAFISVLLMTAWKGFPFFGLIILSSLQSIPDDLYEAADVDGAGVIRQFRAITLPALVPTLTLLTVLGFVFSFQQFSLIYLSTGGGPGTDTSTLSLLIYNQAFTFYNYDYASALAVVGLLIAIIATVLFILVERRISRSRRLENYGGARV